MGNSNRGCILPLLEVVLPNSVELRNGSYHDLQWTSPADKRWPLLPNTMILSYFRTARCFLNIYPSDAIRYFRNRARGSSQLLSIFKIALRDKCIWYIINPGVPCEYASLISTSVLFPLSLHICTSISYMDRLKPVCLHLTCRWNIAIVPPKI